jgi:hypothetical protein
MSGACWVRYIRENDVEPFMRRDVLNTPGDDNNPHN